MSVSLPIHLVKWSEWLESLADSIRIYPLYGIFLEATSGDGLSRLLYTSVFWENINAAKMSICLIPVSEEAGISKLQFTPDNFSSLFANRLGMSSSLLPGLMIFAQPTSLEFSFVSLRNLGIDDVLENLSLMLSEVINRTNYHGNGTEQLTRLEAQMTEVVRLLERLPKSSGYLRPNAERELQALQSRANVLKDRLAKPEKSSMMAIREIERLLQIEVHHHREFKKSTATSLVEAICQASGGLVS